jgi:hypothetical protein
VVIRETGGQVRSLAIVHGTRLEVKGRILVSEEQPVSRALDF